jgi:hypothetical protein
MDLQKFSSHSWTAWTCWQDKLDTLSLTTDRGNDTYDPIRQFADLEEQTMVDKAILRWISLTVSMVIKYR